MSIEYSRGKSQAKSLSVSVRGPYQLGIWTGSESDTVHITANLYKNCDKIKTKQRQSCEKKTTKHDKKPTKTKQGYNV